MVGMFASVVVVGVMGAGPFQPSTIGPDDATPEDAAEVFLDAVPYFEGGRFFETTHGELTVPVGSTLTWTNMDGFEHTIRFTSCVAPESPRLMEGDSYSVTFSEPGTYTYSCGIHPQMVGTIVVEG